MFADACKVIGIMIVIFMKSKGLGILMLMIIPVLFLFTRYIQKRMLKAQMENREAMGKANQHIPETIHNIRMIHTCQKEDYMERKYDNYIKDSYQLLEKSLIRLKVLEWRF